MMWKNINAQSVEKSTVDVLVTPPKFKKYPIELTVKLIYFTMKYKYQNAKGFLTMGFWDKLEAWAEKVEKNAKNFEDKANSFLEKNFPEEREEFTSYGLLDNIKKRFNGIFTEKILVKVKSIRSNTTHLDKPLNEGITYATIEELEKSLNPNLATPQYKITIKGLTAGEDDYNSTTGVFKFDVYVIIDKYSDYVIDSIYVNTKY